MHINGFRFRIPHTNAVLVNIPISYDIIKFYYEYVAMDINTFCVMINFV